MFDRSFSRKYGTHANGRGKNAGTTAVAAFGLPFSMPPLMPIFLMAPSAADLVVMPVIISLSIKVTNCGSWMMVSPLNSVMTRSPKKHPINPLLGCWSVSNAKMPNPCASWILLSPLVSMANTSGLGLALLRSQRSSRVKSSHPAVISLHHFWIYFASWSGGVLLFGSSCMI